MLKCWRRPVQGEAGACRRRLTDNTLDRSSQRPEIPFRPIRLAPAQPGLTEAAPDRGSQSDRRRVRLLSGRLAVPPEDTPASATESPTGPISAPAGNREVRQTVCIVGLQLVLAENIRAEGARPQLVKAFRRVVVESVFLRKDWHRYLVLRPTRGSRRRGQGQVVSRAWGKTKFSVWRIPVVVLDMMAVKFQIRSCASASLLRTHRFDIIFLGVVVGLYCDL